MEIIATHQCNLSEARLGHGRDSSILLPLVWPRFHGRGIVCTRAAVQNRHRKECRCRQTFLWICFWRLRTETMRRRRQHPFVPLTGCDWDLVTESHSSRGRVRNGCNDRFSKRNLTAGGGHNSQGRSFITFKSASEVVILRLSASFCGKVRSSVCMYPYPMDLNLSPSPYISRLD